MCPQAIYITMRVYNIFFLSLQSDVRGEVPPVVTVINVVKTAVYAYVATLVAIGVMLSLLCLVFIIVYRKRKLVNYKYTCV